jgi:asparaginyl-tRNA synthetase
MELVSIREIFKNNKDYIGKEVNIGGWLRSKRDSKSFGFLVVNDGTFFEPIQVVYSDELD